MTMSDCPVQAFLDRYDNGDREQLEIALADRTRNPYLIARGFDNIDGRMTGNDILKHQHRTCPCGGWTD